MTAKRIDEIIENPSMQDILIVIFEMQAVMDAILDELGRKAAPVLRRGDPCGRPMRAGTSPAPTEIKGVVLVASRCSTCARLEANGGDCEVGYGVYPACRDWIYHG